MIRITYSVRPYIRTKTSQVAVRVRWNSKTCEVSFITGVYAERSKWDDDLMKAKKGTTHHIRRMTFTAAKINSTVASFVEEIEDCFTQYSLKNSVPTTDELKHYVNRALGREDEERSTTVKRKTIEQMYKAFIKEVGNERNWDDICKEKYNQAYTHLVSAVPNVTPDTITLDAMYTLRDWYVKNKYKNRTTNKQIVMLKCFLKWINEQEGYTIPTAVLKFKTNLKVMRRTVTFLSYDELMHFANYHFSPDQERLSHARDYWCFMAFTSLRYSDLADLKTAHFQNGWIVKKTIKTGEEIRVPLVDAALAIYNKYKDAPDKKGHVFPVTTDQKLNDAVKDAAKVAGIDREIIESYYIGNKREEEQHKFYDIISCHDARRTFVCCSLALGIPAQTVMKCTGHSSYNTMKPYIETASKTQEIEMEKWNNKKDDSPRSKLITLLENANDEQIAAILKVFAKKN